MKKTLLCFVVMLAYVSFAWAQTTTYLDFEGTYPNPGVFGGSDFTVVANPQTTGVNTSANVVKTQKGAGAQTWGGVVFPLGGTINFTPDHQIFTIDVLSDSIGSVGVKLELGTAPNKELRLEYTTPGVWQTLTADFSVPTDQLPGNLNLVIFMAFFTTDTDVWYWDNVKGPDFTVGAPVDVTFSLTDLGGTVTSAEVELSNNAGVKIPLTGAAGLWTLLLPAAAGSTIMNPVSYTIYTNGVAVPELTNQPWVMAGSAATTIAKNVGKPEPGTELITNGGFDGIEGVLGANTGKLWGMYSGNGGVAEVISGVATVTPVQSSGEIWQMQLIQQNFYLENGKTYTASFDAWSAADRVIELSIEDPPNGYNRLGSSLDADALNGRSKWDINISTVQTKYQRTLLVDGMKANTVTKFVFILAQTSDVVYIDNVSLIEKSSESVGENNLAGKIKVYPNPVENNLYFSEESGFSKILVYNVQGTQVKEFANVAESINISDLKTGVYMIRLTGNDGQTYASKFMKK